MAKFISIIFYTMAKIIERIALVIKEKGVSVRSFEMQIGASNGAIGRAISKGTDIVSEWLSKIIEANPDLSAEWLLTGKGTMLRSDAAETPSPTSPVSPSEAYLERVIKEKDAEIRELNRELGACDQRLRDLLTKVAPPTQGGVKIVPSSKQYATSGTPQPKSSAE